MRLVKENKSSAAYLTGKITSVPRYESNTLVFHCRVESEFENNNGWFIFISKTGRKIQSTKTN